MRWQMMKSVLLLNLTDTSIDDQYKHCVRYAFASFPDGEPVIVAAVRAQRRIIRCDKSSQKGSKSLLAGIVQRFSVRSGVIKKKAGL